jgi:hypothetical protein
VDLGYVIGGGELKIDPAKMEAIMKWPVHTNCIEVNIFVGVAQYLWKFIALFSTIVVHLHTITMGTRSFQWGKNQHKSFDEMKRNINQAPVLTLPKLQKPFEVDRDASGYAMGAVLMQGERHVYYHFEVFHGVVLNYPTRDKDLYALVHAVKKWEHYLMGKHYLFFSGNPSTSSNTFIKFL